MKKNHGSIIVIISTVFITALFSAVVAGAGEVESVCEHDWYTVGTNLSDCEEGGTADRICFLCKAGETVIIPKADHSWAEWEEMHAPTCKEGYERRECSACNKEEVRAIAPIYDHQWRSWSKNISDCEQGGTETLVCDKCNTWQEVEIPKAEHSWGEWFQTELATCFDEGQEERLCSVCSVSETRVKPTTPHEWDKWEVIREATVSRPGEKTRKCLYCSASDTAEIPQLEPSLKITGEKSFSLKKGKTCSLPISIARGDTVSVDSSNEKIADAYYAKDTKYIFFEAGDKSGKAVITIKTDTGKTDKIYITVPKAKTMKITCKAVTVKIRGKETLNPVVEPYYSDDKITYKVKNKKIASVSAKGVVTGKKAGSTTVTVKSGKKTVKVKVTVVPLIKPHLEYGSVTLTAENNTIKNRFLSGDYKTGKVTWSSSNSKIAGVNNKGKITAKSKGTCTVTATCDGKKYRCIVNVVTGDPNFALYISDYYTRDNFFSIKVQNFSKRPLVIYSSSAKVCDRDYKSYDRNLYLTSSQVTIKPYQKANLRFYVRGGNNLV